MPDWRRYCRDGAVGAVALTATAIFNFNSLGETGDGGASAVAIESAESITNSPAPTASAAAVPESVENGDISESAPQVTALPLDNKSRYPGPPGPEELGLVQVDGVWRAADDSVKASDSRDPTALALNEEVAVEAEESFTATAEADGSQQLADSGLSDESHTYTDTIIVEPIQLDNGAGAPMSAPSGRPGGMDPGPYYGPETHVDGGVSLQVANSQSGGAMYFPTEAEADLIGGDYRRGNALNEIRPPGYPANYDETFPYADPQPNFYARHDAFFGPLDDTLRHLTPNDSVLLGGNSQLEHFSYAVDANWPIFFRGYDPNRAHVKAGPLYLDVLSAGAGVIYSDFRSQNGRDPFPDGADDGWLSYLDLTVRAYVRITDRFYLAAAATFFYLPGENEFGVRVGAGAGPATLAYLNYEDEWGLWDVRGYDRFSAYLGGDIYADASDPAYDRAGRYSFGFQDNGNRSSPYFDSDTVAFVNELGAQASRPVGYDWRSHFHMGRRDFWRSYDFDEHGERYHAGVLLGYEGSRLPFSPYIAYDGYTNDEFESLFHTAYVGGNGRITDNLRITARGGYLWSTGADSDTERWLWNVGLTHDISEDTVHSLRGGQDFFASDFSDDFVVSEFIRYNIGHQLAETLYISGFAQLSEDEGLTDDSFTGHRELYGGRLTFLPRGHTRMQAGATVERRRQAPVDVVEERYLYFLSIDQQIATRTTADFRYQFEEVDGRFDEHFFRFGVTRYF